ncbi:MAG: GTP 3',8-cyclase MoaA [Actinomycetota bacterium]|nr:GTP 3',8-cyclase MoaA [Actinomycetota bacterium]
MELVDNYGRRVRDLRISITDRCNFRCQYCMPAEGMQWVPRDEILSFEEIERLARLVVDRYDFTGIRLTGGEPTMRSQLVRLVERLASIRRHNGEAIDLAMTTNGATLSHQANDLKAAGLGRLNISLDTLSRDRFAEMTRRDQFDKVIEGIRAAQAAGFSKLKINTVVMRGHNDGEILDFIEFGRKNLLNIRFIEFMPLDGDDIWNNDLVVPSDEIVDQISANYELVQIDNGSDPASRYVFADMDLEFGVIPTVTKPFCESCDRIRLTAEGQLRNCLFSVEEYDLRKLLRNEGSDEEILAVIERAVGDKWRGHSIGNVNFLRPKRSMSQIGG